MKKLIFILILLSTFVVFAERPVVAVFEIENKTSGKNRLSDDEIELIAELMRSELIKCNEFEVMRKDEMDAAISQHVKKSHQLNRDRNYAIGLGKTISARFIIISKILKDGKLFRISAEMIDTEIGTSGRSGNEKFTIDDDSDSKDEAIASIIRQLLGEKNESLIPKKPKMSEDQLECEHAKTENTAESWETYLEFYPRGVCVQEAKEKLDEIACQQALRANTIEALQEYLDNFNGKCKVEASKNIKKLKKAASKSNSSYNNPQHHGGNSNSAADTANTELVGNREWSELSEKKMNFREAKNYCKKLRDNGNSDWRLPTIDELRTLIKSCPGSETFGACKISEAENCLSNACISDRYCECGPNSMGEHSKLEDTAIIWSSSSKTGANDRIFIVDFLRGGISTNSVETRNNVRCTR